MYSRGENKDDSSLPEENTVATRGDPRAGKSGWKTFLQDAWHSESVSKDGKKERKKWIKVILTGGEIPEIPESLVLPNIKIFWNEGDELFCLE